VVPHQRLAGRRTDPDRTAGLSAKPTGPARADGVRSAHADTELIDPATVTDDDIAGMQRVLAASAAADGAGDPVPTVEELAERIRFHGRTSAG
jgi:hypothetical protein